MQLDQKEFEDMDKMSAKFVEEKTDLGCVESATSFSMSKDNFNFFLNDGKSFRITPISLVCYDSLNAIDCDLLCGG